MASPPLAEDFKTTPYWWEAAPRPEPAETELPAQADVVVVGSGVTGLQAALATARGGREALVIEAGLAGTGASTRNAGNVVPYLWAKHGWLEKKLGRAQAAALAAGGEAAQAYFIAFVEREQISCGLVPGNRYFLALTAKHFAHLKKDASVFDELGVSPPWVPISAAELRTETGLEGYHGAVAVRGSRSFHPGLYHQGLMDRAEGAGARIVANTPVTDIARRPGGGFTVTTDRGTLEANDVVLATNGYTPKAAPWLRRRVLPIKSYQAASEPVPPALLDKWFPEPRVLIDSKINVTWIRLTPDRTRVIVGGRTGMDEGDLRTKATHLHGDLVRILPDFADIKLSHCWEGQMAFTFDRVPHIGIADGMHYAAGFCGVGMTMGSWLGHQIGRRLTGADDATTPFDGRRFTTRPFYTGNPWLLPVMIGWFGVRDRWDRMTG